MSNEKLTVFIASGEASRLERKVLQYSIKKNCSDCVEVIVYNGTHDALEYPDGRKERLNTPLNVKYTNVTEFSNFRWYIPGICHHEGRAVYVDSDMICLKDMKELLDLDMEGNDMLAKPDAYEHEGERRWGMSMVLFNNATARFDIDQYFQEIEAGEYAYGDLHRMTPGFLAKHPFKLGSLPAGWNEFDVATASTKLIHYTDLYRQPWKFAYHDHGDLWFRYFKEAQEAGFVTDEDINLSVARAYVRPDIREGNTPKPRHRGIKHSAQLLLAALKDKVTGA